jgi:YggT family protein
VLYNIFNLIINTITGLMASILLLRFWMQLIHVRPPQQLAQFMFQLSDWLVLPLRRVVPGTGGYDWSSMVAALLVGLVAAALSMVLLGRFNILVILLLAVHNVLQWILYGFIGVLIISAVFSWINPNAPLAPFFNHLSEPILRPLRRIVPLIGNIDLSPLVALIILQIGLQIVNGLFAFL